MTGLAPKASSMGCRRAKATPVSTTEHTHSIKKLLERIRRASSILPAPMRMLISGAPPTPTKEAKAPIMVTTGPQMPTPASATSPMAGRLLM